MEFFRKDGISWHGAVVLFRMEDDDLDAREYLETFVIDHIPSSENAQENRTVLSFFHAIVARIEIKLPTVTHYLRRYRQLPNLSERPVTSFSAFAVLRAWVRLEPLIHPESVCGKEIVNAHFSLAMRYYQS